MNNEDEEVARKLYYDICKLIAGTKVDPGLNALMSCIAILVVHISIEDEVPAEVMVKDICEALSEKVNFFMDNYKSNLTEYVV